MIKSLAHACFVVSDLGRSIEFYSALGMVPAFEFRNDEGKRTGVYLSCGGRTFIEMFAGKPTPVDGSASYRHISLEVDSLDRLLSELAGRGIEATEKKMGKDHSWQAWVTDPDGNRVELHEYTAESEQAKAIAKLGGEK